MHVLCISIGLAIGLQFAAQVLLGDDSENIKHQGLLELCKIQ